MRIVSMIFSELRHRPFNALLLSLVVAASSGLVVYFETSAEGMDNETRLIQKAMGSNLTLIPADSDSAAYQLTGVVDTTMPEQVVDSLLEQGAVSMNHLIAVLERPIEINKHPAMLTGIAKSRATPGRPKAPMNDGVEPGHVEIGYGLAELLGVAKGDSVELFGKPYTVSLVYVEKGGDEDYRVYADLADVQSMLGLAGQINKIEAIDCVSCADPSEEALPILREELAAAAPQAQVFRASNLADARSRQRTAISQYREILIPVVIGCGLIVVAGIVMLNVRDRRPEIGVLRAMGKSTASIAGLFLGKAVLLALVGAAIGAVFAGWFAMRQGEGVFAMSAHKLVFDWTLVVWAIVLAPLFVALAAALPTLDAVLKDPAISLREN